MVLVTDTVGFIRRLPPTLVTAFKATLEELDEASLLVHVVDITSPHAAEQCQTVEGILAEMKLADKPRITALNKIDILLPGSIGHDEKSVTTYLSRLGPRAEKNTVLISAEKKWGLDKLGIMIAGTLDESHVTAPYLTC